MEEILAEQALLAFRLLALADVAKLVDLRLHPIGSEVLEAVWELVLGLSDIGGWSIRSRTSGGGSAEYCISHAMVQEPHHHQLLQRVSVRLCNASSS